MPIKLNIKVDLVLITTCTCGDHISTLLKSITDYNQHINVAVISVCQNNVQISNEGTSYTDIHTVNLDSKISLSKARNIALNYIKENDISFDYIMFPDDDSSFDAHFFSRFKKYAKSCMLIDVYGTGTCTLYKKHNLIEGQILTISDHPNAMSVNMIIGSKIQKMVGPFDENLGVGTYYGAGEDNDYYIRCIKAGATFYYTNRLWTFHPLNTTKHHAMPLSKLISRYQSYGRGAIYMFLKHQMNKDALKCIFLGFSGILSALLQFKFKLACARICGVHQRIKTYIIVKVNKTVKSLHHS